MFWCIMYLDIQPQTVGLTPNKNFQSVNALMSPYTAGVGALSGEI